MTALADTVDRASEQASDSVRATEITPPGRVVGGRYRIRSLLGRGGMGRVWRAEDQATKRPVALKQLLVRGPRPAEMCVATYSSALREARAATWVDHIGAVKIYDVVEDRGPWIVMELLQGRTLKDAGRAEGRLPVDEVARVGLCLVDVLRAIHGVDLVHCDVKPGNVHLGVSGRVVLFDFGIATATGDHARTATGEFAGSPAYVAPERIRGAAVAPTCDLFSLGATLFAAVEGRSPFDQGSSLDTLIAVARGTPAPFVRAGPLAPVIAGLLTRDPEQRLTLDEAEAAIRRTTAAPQRRPIRQQEVQP